MRGRISCRLGSSRACRAILACSLAAVFAAVVLLAPLGATATTTSADPARVSAREAFVTHRGRNWSWAGPRNWDAAYGTYGITVSGPRSGFDLGFSSLLCTPAPNAGASAVRYFAAQRRQLARGANILGKTRIRRVGRLGPNYFRQSVNIGTRRNRTRYFGQVIYDYEVSGPTYCYQRSLAFGAPARGYGASLRVLFRVFNSLAYFGPGAYEDGEGPNES